jgi:multidrug efflux system membrane fusion protein
VGVLACPGQRLRGVVQGVGKAIYPHAGYSVDALPEVAPALDWVRLAQRFPVRIMLDHPPTCTLHSGSTATVRIMTGGQIEGPIIDGVRLQGVPQAAE